MHSTTRRGILMTAAACAAAGIALAGAAPAAAAGRTVAPGDAMYVIDCDFAFLVDPVLFSVDPATAALTEIAGSIPTDVPGCAFQPAHDATTGASYFIQLDDGDATSLLTVDRASGVSTVVGEFFIATTPTTSPFILSMAIGADGLAYAIDDEAGVYAVDLESAELTFIDDLGVDGEFHAFTAGAAGRFYAVSIPGDIVYSVEIDANAMEVVATDAFSVDAGTDTNVLSLQLDSAGLFWFITAPVGGSPELWSTSGQGGEVFSGTLTSAGDVVFTGALLIAPGPPVPALPATGAVSMPALTAALVILSAGGVIVLLPRRRAT